MSGLSVPVYPIRLCASVSTVHSYCFSSVGNGVIESHIEKEIGNCGENVLPLFSGKPSPFKTVNLVLVSTYTLSNDRTVSVTAGVHNRGDDYSDTSLARR